MSLFLFLLNLLLEFVLDRLPLGIDFDIGHLVELLLFVHDPTIEIGASAKDVALLLLFIEDSDSTCRSYPNVLCNEFVSCKVHVLVIKVLALSLTLNPIDSIREVTRFFSFILLYYVLKLVANNVCDLLEGLGHRAVAIEVQVVELTAKLDAQLVHHLVGPPIHLVACQVDVLLPFVDDLFLLFQFLNLLMQVHDLLPFC